MTSSDYIAYVSLSYPCPSSVVRRLSSVVCRPSSVVCRPSSVVRRPFRSLNSTPAYAIKFPWQYK